VKQNAKEWQSRMRDLGVESRLLLDVAAVCDGVRPFGLWHCRPGAIPLLESLCRTWGLECRAAKTLWSSPDPHSRENVLHDRPLNSSAIETREVWFGRPGELDSIHGADIGLRLGYPPCCVRRYADNRTLNQYFADYLNAPLPGFWEINRLAWLFSPQVLMLDYFPCRLDCEPSRRLGEKMVEVARRTMDADYLQAAETAQKTPLLVLNGQLLWNPCWRVQDSQMEIHVTASKSGSLSEVFAFPAELVPPQLVPFAHLPAVRTICLKGHHESVCLHLEEGRWISKQS
jgi:hypothetical protein